MSLGQSEARSYQVLVNRESPFGGARNTMPTERKEELQMVEKKTNKQTLNYQKYTNQVPINSKLTAFKEDSVCSNNSDAEI